MTCTLSMNHSVTWMLNEVIDNLFKRLHLTYSVYHNYTFWYKYNLKIVYIHSISYLSTLAWDSMALIANNVCRAVISVMWIKCFGEIAMIYHDAKLPHYASICKVATFSNISAIILAWLACTSVEDQRNSNSVVTVLRQKWPGMYIHVCMVYIHNTSRILWRLCVL